MNFKCLYIFLLISKWVYSDVFFCFCRLFSAVSCSIKCFYCSLDVSKHLLFDVWVFFWSFEQNSVVISEKSRCSNLLLHQIWRLLLPFTLRMRPVIQLTQCLSTQSFKAISDGETSTAVEVLPSNLSDSTDGSAYIVMNITRHRFGFSGCQSSTKTQNFWYWEISASSHF